MASLIPGYEYDIFISYRQKDNKGDRWVSEFVEALKTELESTFKEEISVYFDINPHDGLLETHDVDESLKDKLKCLVFIPIISRTYCDPKSFAWEHEFKVFVDLASKDQFGLKVKLPNGNVANRIVPVQIHELHLEDKTLIEKELGGVLRAIEFIYKEPGVNKPLTAIDNEKKNLNNTTYRIQINKVANAIDEIIHSLKGKQPSPDDRKLLSDQPYHDTVEERKNKELSGTTGIYQISKKWLIMLLSVILCVVGALAIFKVIEDSKRSNDIAKLEKSIAVLPFVNDSPDQENTYFINGIMDEILNNLQKIKDFRVLSRTSTEQYRGVTKPTIPKIAKDLDVNYIVEGSGQKYGNTFRLRVQLIAANNEKHLWGDSYEQEIQDTKDIFRLQSQVAQSIALALEASITPEEKQRIEKPSTTNLTAYDFYQRGIEEYIKYSFNGNDLEAVKRAEPLFRNALKYDSTFALAYAGLADVYWKRHNIEQQSSDIDVLNNYLDSMLILSDIALSYDDQVAEAYCVRGGYYFAKGNSKKTIEEWDKAIKCNPNDWFAYYDKGWFYEYFLYDPLRSIENFQKAASLNHGTGLSELLTRIGFLYYKLGFPEKGNDFLLESLKLDGDSVKYLDNLIDFTSFTQGDYKKAIEHYEKKYLKDSTDVGSLYSLGFCNLVTCQYKESLKYFNKLISRLKSSGQSDPTMPRYIGYAFWQNGFKREAEYYFDKQIEISNKNIKSNSQGSDVSVDYYSVAGVYAFRGDKCKAYKYLEIFNQNQIFALMGVTIIKNDPLFDRIRNEPEFQQIVKDVEAKYQVEHERVRKWLEEQDKL